VAETRKPNKLVVVGVLVVHSVVAAVTWRDLRSRPAERIRGPKRIWQIASAVNTLGSIAYWVVGRKR
jgi:hypothetical protein